MNGKELIKKLTENNDLPTERLQQELVQLIQGQGFNENSVTLDQLREVVANYLQDVFVATKDSLG